MSKPDMIRVLLGVAMCQQNEFPMTLAFFYHETVECGLSRRDRNTGR